MKIVINSIVPARFLQEKIVSTNKEEEIDQVENYLMNNECKIYISKRDEIEWNTWEDRFSGEMIKIGLKYIDVSFKWNEKYVSIKGNLSWNMRDRQSELYVTRFNIFNKKISNGVLVTSINEEIGAEEFVKTLEKLSKSKNFLQVFEDSSDIEEAIEIYGSLVSKREKEGSKSLPVSIFKISDVWEVDFKKTINKSIDYFKGKRNTFIESKAKESLPSDSIGQKFIMLKNIKPIELPNKIKQTLSGIIKDGGQLTVSDTMKLKLGKEIVKLIDFKVSPKKNGKYDLILFLKENVNEDKVIHIFNRLEKIKSETMLSVVEDIKRKRINNNNLFQFLFNKGDFANISKIGDWKKSPSTAKKMMEELDDLQIEAFNLAIDDFPVAFIQGPPGTGKTHVISKICRYYESLGMNVLVSSQTNVAVENILEKLNEDTTYNGIAIKADFNKSDYSLAKLPVSLGNKISKILEVDNFDLSQFGVNDILTNSNIVGSTTTSSSLNGRMWREFYKNIDVLIVDEISKSSVPELIRYVANSKKVIFVGDQRQLEPLQDFDERDEEIWKNYSQYQKDIIKNYISVSIFDTLFKTMKKNKRAIMLRVNRRSVQSLANVYSTFYNNKLKAFRNEKDTNIQWKGKPWYPFTFLAMNGSQELKDPKTKSRYNVREAEYVDKLLNELSSNIKNSKELTVAIIALYGQQVQKIQELTEINYHRNENFKNIKVNTVDAFQGDQADIVILSTVRADKTASAGFANNYRRINVALSRAKDLAVVLGNDSILKNIPMKYDGTNRLFFNEIFIKVNKEHNNNYEKPIKFVKVG